MPQFNTLRIDAHAGNLRVARLLLNRPDKLNAINDDTAREIPPAVQWRDSGKLIPEGDEARGLVRPRDDKRNKDS